MIVNGNPEVANRPRPPVIRAAPVPHSDSHRVRKEPGNCCDRLGPEKFAEWTRSAEAAVADGHYVPRCAPVADGDADAHLRHAARSPNYVAQRTAATVQPGDVGRRDVRRQHAVPAGRSVDALAVRCAKRSRTSVSRCCCALRTRWAIRPIPDNVVREFIAEAAAQGIDIFRIFDSLNWMPNMKVAVEAMLKTGRICEAAICYTGDILDPSREKYSLDYYVRLAKELKSMGAHVLGIKDMAGSVAALRCLQAGEDSARGERACRFTSTRTTPAASTRRRC